MVSTLDYSDRIPNNVDLGRDRVLQRALEQWQPAFMSWKYDMGPNESHDYDVYLRTAVSVDPEGWANFARKKRITCSSDHRRGQSRTQGCLSG